MAEAIRNRTDRTDQNEEFEQKVISINRVAKVVKGGRRFSFSALVIVGNGKGKYGVGFGKANEVPEAINKAVDQANKSLEDVPLEKRTVTHEVTGRFGGGRVLIRPASEGTGVIAGGPVRAIMEAIGIHDVLTKSMGSSNPINIVRATVDGLRQLKNREQVSRMRGVPVEDLY